jgi:leader peptidase (prepilin peptidase)/N-methyltransferase
MNDLGPLLFVGVLGAIIGSFLNVCIYRLPRERSIVRPGSACPRCGRPLSWRDNIPVISYLVLRGRCRGCRGAISMRYPLVELLTASMFVAAWLAYGPTALFASRVVFGSALIALFAIDLEHHLLPNPITLGGIAAGLAFSLFTAPGWKSALAGTLIGGGVLFVIAEAYYRLRHEEGLGMGDVKMLGMIGAFLGWKLTLVALMMASVAGSLVGLGVIVTRRGSLKYALPFGSFLALGAGLAIAVGPSVLKWYLGLWW